MSGIMLTSRSTPASLQGELAVLVETCEETSDHIHDVDPDYTPDNTNMIRWPAAVTAIIMTGVRNEARPKDNLRNLRDSNVFDGMAEPSMIQFYNKITNVKNVMDKSRDILTTHDFLQKVADHLETPESEIEAFIPFYEVLDEEDNEDPRFTVIMTSKKLLARISSDRFDNHQILGFPCNSFFA